MDQELGKVCARTGGGGAQSSQVGGAGGTLVGDEKP